MKASLRDNMFQRIVENYVTLLLKQFNFTKMSRQFNWTGWHFSEMCQNLASPSIPGNWNGFCLYLLDILRNVECKADFHQNRLQQAAGGNLSEFKLWTLNRSLLEPFCVDCFIKSSQKIKQKVSIEVIVLVQFCNIRHSQYRSLNKLQCSYIQSLALAEL